MNEMECKPSQEADKPHIKAVKKCKLRRDKYCSSNGNAAKWTDTLHFLTTPYNRSQNAFLIKSPYYNVPVM